MHEVAGGCMWPLKDRCVPHADLMRFDLHTHSVNGAHVEHASILLVIWHQLLEPRTLEHLEHDLMLSFTIPNTQFFLKC